MFKRAIKFALAFAFFVSAFMGTCWVFLAGMAVLIDNNRLRDVLMHPDWRLILGIIYAFAVCGVFVSLCEGQSK